MLQFLKKDGSGKWQLVLILLGAALGVLLLLFGSDGEKTETVQAESIYSPSEDEVVIYREYLEKQIKETCQSVQGVGEATVIVTLSGGFESVYATEESGEKEEYVILGSGSSAKALLLSRNAPKIVGVGVICRGGDSVAVQNELISLLSASLGISSNRIHVSKSK